MSILVKQFLSKGGGTENNSLLEFNNTTYAMIIEGYNGIDSNPKMPDVSWYLENFSELLNEAVEHVALPSTFLISQTIETLQIKHQIEAVKLKESIVTDTYATPYASFAMIREFQDNIELFSLGNCSIILELNNPLKLEHIYKNTMDLLEQSILNEMLENHLKKNIDVIDTLELPILHRHRKNIQHFKNKIDGYWVLGLDINAVRHATYLRYPKSSIKQVTMYTSGFRCIESQFMNLSQDQTLNKLYQTLRTIENEDKGCNKYPRFSQNSDVSAIIANIIE